MTIGLSMSAIARVRFAVSPLWETIASLRVLRDPGGHAVHLPWASRVRQLDVSRLAGLVPPAPGYIPDFLTPTPPGPFPGLDEELAALAATPADVVEAQSGAPLDPGRLAQALREYFTAAIAPDWPRIRALLEAEVHARSRSLAADGLGGLLNDLHANVSFANGTLSVLQRWCTAADVRDGGDLVLVPSVFVWPSVLTVFGAQAQLAYPPRGVGVLWESRAGGASRARGGGGSGPTASRAATAGADGGASADGGSRVSGGGGGRVRGSGRGGASAGGGSRVSGGGGGKIRGTGSSEASVGGGASARGGKSAEGGKSAGRGASAGGGDRADGGVGGRLDDGRASRGTAGSVRGAGSDGGGGASAAGGGTATGVGGRAVGGGGRGASAGGGASASAGVWASSGADGWASGSVGGRANSSGGTSGTGGPSGGASTDHGTSTGSGPSSSGGASGGGAASGSGGVSGGGAGRVDGEASGGGAISGAGGWVGNGGGRGDEGGGGLRGGNWDAEGAESLAALAALVGRARARLLVELAIPASTSDLAARTGLTPGCVSQHLAVLRAAGLVRAHRAGRAVINVRTDAAEVLLNANGV